MRIRVRSIPALAAGSVLLILCLAPGCSGEAAPAANPGGPVRGGTAVLGSIADVDSWNEYVSQQAFAGQVLRRVFLRLAQETADGLESPDAFEPLLAESWSFGDDGRSLTFRLRAATWSDGVPVTAADVRFTWLAQTSEHVPWIAAASKSRITDAAICGLSINAVSVISRRRCDGCRPATPTAFSTIRRKFCCIS